MRRNKGFTLIEVIISLLILAITASTMASAFYVGSKALMRNQKKRVVLALAQEALEYAKSQPFGEDITLPSLPEEFSSFTRKVSTKYVKPSPPFATESSSPTDYIRITVTVSEPDVPDLKIVTLRNKYLIYTLYTYR